MTYAILVVETDVSRNNLPPEWHTFAGSKEQLEGYTELSSGTHLFLLPQTLPALSPVLAALDRFQVPYRIAILAEEPVFHQPNASRA